MRWLDNDELERSDVIANCRMNRERGAVGVNSYEKELRFNPIDFLEDRLAQSQTASWLDLCCGRGRALIEAASHFAKNPNVDNVRLHGVDLIDMFDEFPVGTSRLTLTAASLHRWKPEESFALITCVHGLHYIGDKLDLIARSQNWLTEEGRFVANLDLTNLRFADGSRMRRRLTNWFRGQGIAYDSRRHLITAQGRRSVSFPLEYLGADDRAGPNASGENAVNSYYEYVG